MGCFNFSLAVVGGGVVVLDCSADDPPAVGGVAQELAARCNVPTLGSRTTDDTDTRVEETRERCDCALRGRTRLDDLGEDKHYEKIS